MFVLAFVSHASGVRSKVINAKTNVKEIFSPMSVSRNFMVSSFIFNSLVYFNLNFCKFYKIGIQFHSKACVNLVLPRPFISVTIFFALCLGTPVKDESIYMHRFISDSLFCFIHLCVCFSASTILFKLL